VNLVHSIPGGKRAAATLALALAALFAALAVSAATAPSASAATCPSFRVLHNDRIGAVNLPAGNYTITTEPASGLTCAQSSALLARFLQDWDGNLPGNWRAVSQGTGKAAFVRGNVRAFTIVRSGGGGEEEGGNNNRLGQLCPESFQVNARMLVGPLFFERGSYLIYRPARSGISCRRAAILFTRFLGQPGGRLPFPWHVMTQTATFFKPENPVRSAFRVESATGS
jgi:hypothetical protein